MGGRVDQMDARVDELLTLWGYWMQRAPGVPRLGYPSTSIGGHLLGRTPANEKRAERVAAIAQRAAVREVELADGDGVRRERVLHMVPQAQPQQTYNNRSWQPTEWPPVVDEVERVVAQMTPRERRAVRLRYWYQLSQVEAAQAMGVSVTLYKRTVEQARRFFAGYLLSKKAA